MSPVPSCWRRAELKKIIRNTTSRTTGFTLHALRLTKRQKSKNLIVTIYKGNITTCVYLKQTKSIYLEIRPPLLYKHAQLYKYCTFISSYIISRYTAPKITKTS